MKCKECKYYREETIKHTDKLGYVLKMCEITHQVNPIECDLETDASVKDMDICYNCKSWFGGGDWGLSCAKDYWICSSNGFSEACDKFERREEQIDESRD